MGAKLDAAPAQREALTTGRHLKEWLHKISRFAILDFKASIQACDYL